METKYEEIFAKIVKLIKEKKEVEAKQVFENVVEEIK
jgi:hypothetical protein